MKNNPFCPTEIRFSTLGELQNTLQDLSSSSVCFIMSKSAAKRWKITDFIEQFKGKNSTLIWIDDIPPNPTQKDLVNALKQIRNHELEVIVAIGGGSAIDLAKGISAFYRCEAPCTANEISSRIKNRNYLDCDFVDIIAFPTTAGTGSEVTQWATIWDENKEEKFSIDAPGLKPKKVVIIPELTVSVPPYMTLSTGLDAMCQAVEAYWSKRTTPLVQELAFRAIELFIHNLRKSVEMPTNLAYREKLCRASVLAGLAFSQTRTTACHSISYPLTMHYEVPHGLAVSMTLHEVAKRNRGSFANDEELFSLFEEYGGIKDWINFVSKDIVEMRLSYFGIKEGDIPPIVKRAFTSGRMDNNPVDLSVKDVQEILEAVL